MPLPPTKKPPVKIPSPAISAAALALKQSLTERKIARLTELHVRAAAAAGHGPTRSVELDGAVYVLAGKEHQNVGRAPVGVWVEVTTAGPVGSTITLDDGVVLAADMPGNRSRVFDLKMNDRLPIRFSSATIRAVLRIASPETAVPVY